MWPGISVHVACDLLYLSVYVACDLVYLGSVDVNTPGNDSLLTQTVQQLQSLDLSTMNIVTITVSRDGVTLQENVNGYVRRLENEPDLGRFEPF